MSNDNAQFYANWAHAKKRLHWLSLYLGECDRYSSSKHFNAFKWDIVFIYTILFQTYLEISEFQPPKTYFNVNETKSISNHYVIFQLFNLLIKCKVGSKIEWKWMDQLMKRFDNLHISRVSAIICRVWGWYQLK